jgi:uracil phosphoribosyltransferase
MIRDKDTDRGDFIFYSNRIIRLLVEEGLNHLPVVAQTISTPVGNDYSGVKFQGKICGVSIMRAGESMEQGLRDCCRSVRIGKILIQRDEDTCQPKLFYEKLPTDIADRWVLLLDPMFATGGSAMMAIEVLKAKGVPEDRILFLNIIASPEGVGNFSTRFPKVRVVTSFIDQGLNEKKLVCHNNAIQNSLIAGTVISCQGSVILEIDFTPYEGWKTLCRSTIHRFFDNPAPRHASQDCVCLHARFSAFPFALPLPDAMFSPVYAQYHCHINRQVTGKSP